MLFHLEMSVAQLLLYLSSSELCSFHLISSHHVDVRLTRQLIVWNTLNIHAFTVHLSWSIAARTDSLSCLLCNVASKLKNVLQPAMLCQPDATMNLLPLLPPLLVREWIRVHARLAIQVVTPALLLSWWRNCTSELTWVLWSSSFLQVCR